MKAEIYADYDVEEDNPLNYKEFCQEIKIEDLVIQRHQWKRAALRAEKRNRAAIRKQLELKEECDTWKAIAKGKRCQIFGVDVLLVGQEYWVSSSQFCALADITDSYPTIQTTMVGAVFYNGRPMVYKPELD